MPQTTMTSTTTNSTTTNSTGDSSIHPASFRDPDGFLFTRDTRLYRQINESYAEDYTQLKDSGLYERLVKRDLLVQHEETSLEPETQDGWKVIEPRRITYISYPYEWCFAQLRDAALATLDVAQEALSHGMSLKDASAYNIQFIGPRPVFIDTLSFQQLDAAAPWVAYRQFCQHFLGPLALMAYRDIDLNQLLRSHIDGLPLPLVSKLLPRRTRLRYGLLAHLHLHASAQTRHEDDASTAKTKQPVMSLARHQALLESLRSAVKSLSVASFRSEWDNYYSANNNYTDQAMAAKEQIVRNWLSTHGAPDQLVVDLGANTGRFSAIAAELGYRVVAHDIDPNAVAHHYEVLKNQSPVPPVLPLMLDLTNPPAGGGWQHTERDSFVQRNHNRFVLALALIHHLAIGNNVPLPKIAQFMAIIAAELIIEFVPKSDSQVQRMLASREDIFTAYTVEEFTNSFSQYFQIVDTQPVPESERTVFRMTRLPG